jgi:hypothetical protein
MSSVVHTTVSNSEVNPARKHAILFQIFSRQISAGTTSQAASKLFGQQSDDE